MAQKKIHIAVDQDVVDWFDMYYPGASINRLINRLLRSFKEVHPEDVTILTVADKAAADTMVRFYGPNSIQKGFNNRGR